MTATIETTETTETSNVPLRAAGREPSTGILSTAWTLCRLELRLLTREPMVAFGMIGFPAVTVLVLAGVFGDVPDPEFGGVAPSDHYLAGYIAVIIATLGLITIPVHIATHREHGVLRRFRAAGVSAPALVLSELILGAVVGTASVCIVIATGSAVYGFSTPIDPLGAVGWYVLGLGCFIAIGGGLGMLMPSGRAAAAIGNMVYIPMFLLGGGGPPRDVMTPAMQTISDVLPLTHVVGGMRLAWLGQTDDPSVAWWPVVVAAIAVAFAIRAARRMDD